MTRTGCKQILVQVKNVYGNNLVYPACTQAEHFASIAGTKTLSPYVVEKVKALGYEIRIENKGVVL